MLVKSPNSLTIRQGGNGPTFFGLHRLYREEPLEEEQPSHWVGKLNVEGRLFKPYPVTGRD